MYKRSRLYGGDLGLCLGALFQLCHLLALDGRCGDFLTKDDIAYLTGSQGRDIHAVAFTKVLYNTLTQGTREP